MAEFERPPQSASAGMPRPKYEQRPVGTYPLQEKQLPEESKEEHALKRILQSTLTFIGDLGTANQVAAKTLKENASSRIGKGIAVTTAGVALEKVSSILVGLAFDTILPEIDFSKPGRKDNPHQSLLLKYLPDGMVQEAITDASVYGAYAAGNKFLDNSLPKIPVSFLGWAMGVDLAEFVVRGRAKVPKTPAWDFKAKDTWEVDAEGKKKLKGQFISYTEHKDGAALEDAEKARRDRFNNNLLAKTFNLSNPVTLFGASQITEGLSEYWKALKETRRARVESGQQGVERLLVGSAKAREAEKKKDEQLRRMLKTVLSDENGNGR